MGGLTSRNKGKRAEREVVKVLQPVVTKVYEEMGLEVPELERNLMQSHKGGYDLVGLDWIALEVKHQEAFNLTAWWEQCTRQAKASQEAVLFYRKNNVKWRVRMAAKVLTHSSVIYLQVVDIALEEFLVYFEVSLRDRLNLLHPTKG